MDAHKASSSIAVMAQVLGVTRASYDARKTEHPTRGERALARQRLDEAVAWEHEISGGTYGAPRIRHALTRAGVDVCVRAVAASMRRLGPTGLNTCPRPARRGGRGLVAHEDHCARQWDQGGLEWVWITDVTYLRCAHGWVYLCAAHDAHSRRVLGYAMGEQYNTRSGHHRARHDPPPPVTPSPQGSCPMLIGEHSSPPRNWPPTCAPSKAPHRWGRTVCAGITP